MQENNIVTSSKIINKDVYIDEVMYIDNELQKIDDLIVGLEKYKKELQTNKTVIIQNLCYHEYIKYVHNNRPIKMVDYSCIKCDKIYRPIENNNGSKPLKYKKFKDLYLYKFLLNSIEIEIKYYSIDVQLSMVSNSSSSVCKSVKSSFI